jgi:hypothetical protein
VAALRQRYPDLTLHMIAGYSPIRRRKRQPSSTSSTRSTAPAWARPWRRPGGAARPTCRSTSARKNRRVGSRSLSCRLHRGDESAAAESRRADGDTPAGVEPAPFFALLAKLARRHDVTGLSMG